MVLATSIRRAPNVQGTVRVSVLVESASSHGLTIHIAPYHLPTPNSVQVGDSYRMYFAEANLSGLRMKFPKDKTFTFDIVYRSGREDISQVNLYVMLAHHELSRPSFEAWLALFPPCSACFCLALNIEAPPQYQFHYNSISCIIMSAYPV